MPQPLPNIDNDTALQEALDALLRGDAAAALDRVRPVQAQAAVAGPPLTHGWALWLVSLAHLYLNDIPQAESHLEQANAIALTTPHPALRTAVYLGQQLLSEYQRQRAMRQHVSQLLRELEAGETRLTQQFRTMLSLATETRSRLAPLSPALPASGGSSLPSPSSPPGGTDTQAHYLPPLEVQALGTFRVWQAGQEVRLRPSKKALDIFKYLLAHHPRPVAKDTLIHLLWPDVAASKGSHRLHLAVSSLRAMLNAREGENTDYILYREDTYQLHDKARVTLDINLFAEHYQRGASLEREGRTAEAQAAYEAAIALYGGDYLAESLYDDWTQPTREHLRQMYVALLGRLGAAYVRQGRDEESAVVARRLLDTDLCNEEGHRLLMLVYSRAGQRAAALRQYQTYADNLRREFDADPAPELTTLYREIASQGVDNSNRT